MGKILRFLFNRGIEGAVVVFLISVMPAIPPHAKFQKSIKIKGPMALEGKLAPNDRLNDVEVWHEGDFHGPETFADYNGELYTSIHGGDIIKLTGEHITPVVKFGKPCKGLYQEQICGRPLGITFDKNGALYAADAYYGIFKVDVKTGNKVQLVAFGEEIEGKNVTLPNSLAVASNGDVFWTDSSTEFILQDGIFDMLADGSGRLIHYDAKTKKNKVLINDIHFANGVILADDESFVLVAETAASRIYRYYLQGPKKGTYDFFIEGLPGLPDNLNSDGKGGFLSPLVIPIDKYHPNLFQIFGPFPFVRKFVARIIGLVQLGFQLVEDVYPNEFAERGIHWVGHFEMRAVLPVPPGRVTILRLSKDGEILDNLNTNNFKISSICEAHIFKDYLYLGSPFNKYIARIKLSKLGWDDLSRATTSKPTTTTPKPTTTTPKPSTTTTPKPVTTTTTPKPTTTPQPTTTTTQKPTTTTQRPATTTTQKPTTTTQKPTTTTTQKPTTTTQKPATTTTPKPTTAKPSTTTTTTSKPSTTTTSKPRTEAPTTATPKPPVKEQPKTAPPKESQNDKK